MRSVQALVIAPIITMFGVHDEPRAIFEYVIEHGGAANMNVPQQPLLVDDVERWADILNVSDPQREFMRREYRSFVDAHNAFMDREVPRYLRRSSEYDELRRTVGLTSAELIEPGRQLDRASARLRRAMIDLEHQFIDSLAPGLTPEQRERLVLLRNESTRRNCRSSYQSVGRWFDVELREVWKAEAALVASPQERDAVEEVLWEYEMQLTRLMCRMADLVFEIRPRLLKNRIARREGTISPAEGRRRYERILASRVDLVQDIRIVHEETLDEIVAAVSESVAGLFVNGAKEEAYPELYPDLNHLEAIFAQLVNDRLLDEDFRESVRAFRDAYSREYEQVCAELEEFCNEWCERTTAGERGYRSQFLPEALEPLLEERTELSRRYLMKLHDHLGPDVLARHAAAIPAALRSEVEDLRTD